MQITIKTLIIIFLSFQFNHLEAQNWFSRGASGSGDKTTKTIQTEDYDIIQARGPIDIHLKKGKEGIIEVTTSDNLHQYLEVESKNNRLEISLKRGVNIRNGHFELNVPFESLSKIKLSGSGTIDTQDPITGKILEVSLSGSGDIELSGTSENLNLQTSGSADYSGLALDTQNTSIEISGSGDANVVAHKTLNARISGSGSVHYKGKPDKINTKVSGSGSIKTID